MYTIAQILLTLQQSGLTIATGIVHLSPSTDLVLRWRYSTCAGLSCHWLVSRWQPGRTVPRRWAYSADPPWARDSDHAPVAADQWGMDCAASDLLSAVLGTHGSTECAASPEMTSFSKSLSVYDPPTEHHSSGRGQDVRLQGKLPRNP